MSEIHFERPSKWKCMLAGMDGVVTSAVIVLAGVVILTVALAAAALIMLSLARLSGLVGDDICQVGCAHTEGTK